MRLLINQYRNMAFNLEKIDSLYRDGCFVDALCSDKDEVLASYSSREQAEEAFSANFYRNRKWRNSYYNTNERRN